MDSDIYKSRFSRHFKKLTLLGLWPIEFDTPNQKKLYTAYQCFWTMFLLLSIILQMMDLFVSFGSLRKISYNMCTSVIVIAILMKIILLWQKQKPMNELRSDLWKDSQRFTNEEDTKIQDEAYEKLEYIRKWFYIAIILFFPTWMIASYFSYKWGPRNLPFPAYLPLNVLDDLQYVPAFIFQIACGGYIIQTVVEVDLIMFSLAVQITAYCKILIKDVMKLDEMFQDEEVVEFDVSLHFKSKIYQKREINHFLRRENVKRLLKIHIMRHLELLEYANKFEYIFNGPMFVHMFGGSLLIIVNGLELTMVTYSVSAKLCYQTGYLALIMIDILFICHHLSEMTRECANIGNAVYKTLWYRMDADLRKSLVLILIRSQKPPRVTASKLFPINLDTYLSILKNTYSWLMLFRQLELK